MGESKEDALDRFVRKTHEIFASEPDPDKRWSSLSPALAELLADPEVKEASKSWPITVFRDGRAENLLFYEDPEYGFVINATNSEARPPGGRGLIHDHGHIYTLYGVLDGHQRVEEYTRVDDKSKPDFAEVVKKSDNLVGPGDIHMARPYDIHTEINVGERAVAVIVRSEPGGDFNHGRYDPETGKYWESLGPRQIPVQMLG